MLYIKDITWASIIILVHKSGTNKSVMNLKKKVLKC